MLGLFACAVVCLERCTWVRTLSTVMQLSKPS